MAKSTRSKVKRQYRAKKREEGVYAAIEAARLGRLSAKLAAVKNAKNLVPIGEEDGENDEQLDAMDGGKLDAETSPQNFNSSNSDVMDLDRSTSTSEKISTHGPRNSRREQWRASKGLPARPKSKGMNRLGGVAAKQRSGRPKRRR